MTFDNGTTYLRSGLVRKMVTIARTNPCAVPLFQQSWLSPCHSDLPPSLFAWVIDPRFSISLILYISAKDLLVLPILFLLEQARNRIDIEFNYTTLDP